MCGILVFGVLWGFWNFGIRFYHQTFMDTILSLELNIEILIDSTYIRLPGRTTRSGGDWCFFGRFQHVLLPFITIIFPGMNGGQSDSLSYFCLPTQIVETTFT